MSPRFPFGGAQGAPLDAAGPAGTLTQWLGSDNGSMALFPDGTTTFWTFGDTYLGPSNAPSRHQRAPNVVNTVAIGRVQDKQFQPSYYYRGTYTYDQSLRAIQFPDAFFRDPLTTSANTARYKFYTGKAIFHGKTLFVFLQRIDTSVSPEAARGTLVARVNNACDAAGHSTDPLRWKIEIMDLSLVPNPGFLAEAFLTDKDMYLYGVYNPDGSTPVPAFRTIAARIPLAKLRDAPDRANLAGDVQYLDTAGQWASSGLFGQPFPPQKQCFDVGIPTTEGFTVRFNPGKSVWQALYVHNALVGGKGADDSWVVTKQSVGPFGPWTAETQVFRFPEMTPGNPLYIDRPGLKFKNLCYSPLEIPAFESNPTDRIKFVYSITPLDPRANPFYNTGNGKAFADFDNEFYRIKVSPEVKNPNP